MSWQRTDGPRGARSRGPVRRDGSARSRGRRHLAVLGLVTAVAALAMPAPTMAEVLPSGPQARLVMTGLQAIVGPERPAGLPPEEERAPLPSSFSARLLVENPTDTVLDGVDLVVQVHGTATSRSTLRSALDGGSAEAAGPAIHIVEQRLGPIPPRGFAQLTVELGIDDAHLLDRDRDLTIRPVIIGLSKGLSVLDEVRTAVIGVTRPITRPLETALVVPLDGPAPGTAGSLLLAEDTLLPGSRLDRLLRAVEVAPDETVTAAVAPHAIEDLQRLVDTAVPGANDMLARVRAAAQRAAGIVSTPYALADVPALASLEATETLATAAIVAGRQRLPDLIGSPPSSAHLLVSSQTPSSLDLVPADVLVTTWDDAAGVDLDENEFSDIPPALRTGRSPSGRALDVLVGDPWVTRQLDQATGDHGWSVDAHRVVVESAMAFAERPGLDGRAFAVVPTVGWAAPGRLADEVAARVSAAPWLRLADPATVAARSTATGSWIPADEIAPDRVAMLGRLGVLRTQLEGLAAAVVDVEEQPAVVQRGDDLLRAMSVWPTQDRLGRATGVLEALRVDLDEAIGTVVVPDDSVVTLASERGVVPITVRHPDGVTMDVVVEVASQGRLSIVDGTTRPVRLEEGGTTTVSFEATALGRGTFPLAVTVRTPTGDVVLARALVSVRASAVSRPALYAIGGVILLLLLLGRRRRPEKPTLEVVR